MSTEYMDSVFRRAAIGGMLTPADQLLILKNLLERVEKLEEKNDKPTVSRTRSSKVSKSKTSSA